MKNKVRKKPTSKEIAAVLIEINQKVDNLYRIARELDGVVGMYVEMNGHKEKLNDFIDKKYKEFQKSTEKENEQTRNGTVDKRNISANPENKGSRPEGIRQESK
jgi:hypothetical protein